MKILDKVRQLREKIESMAENLTDEDAIEVKELFERWKPNEDYVVGKRVYYEDKLYKVLIAHASQDTWTPDVSPSLFAEVLIPDPSVIPEWVQPSSTNPYMIGDKVRHNGKKWISTHDYNVWEPGVFGWEEINE